MDGIPIEGGSGAIIAPGQHSGARLNVPSGELKNVKQQDIKAMALVTRLYSAEVAAILDRISPHYRRPPDDPEEFFDRDGEGDLDTDDVPLGYFVDTWGTPIRYFAVRDDDLAPAPGVPPEPFEQRLNTSAFLVQKNRGKPVLVSYGPDGREQLSDEFAGLARDLVGDFGDDDETPGRIDNVFNEDNVYVDETLNERLRQGNTVD